MNKFAEMTAFANVVDTRSFLEATRRLNTTKSQVSQHIQQLERRLGRVLLNRTRPLSLTDLGRTCYEHACRLLQEPEWAEASVLDADDDLCGQLHLSAPLAFTSRYLTPLLTRFVERHPQLRADVQADDRFVNLQELCFDMVLRMGRLDDSCLVVRPITTNRHLLYASPGCLARHGMLQHPEELQAHDGLVYYNRKLDDMLYLSMDGKPVSFRIRVRMYIDPEYQLLEGAHAGLGLAILPSSLAAEALLVGELLPTLPGYLLDGGQVSVVYRKTQRTPQKVFVPGQFLEEEVGDPAPRGRALIEYGLLPPG